MTTVKLVRHHSGFQNVADGFTTLEPGCESAIDEYTQEIGEYTLPDGYSVARTTYGDTAIFDANDDHCEIVMHPSGRPQLVSVGIRMPVLTRVVPAS